MRRLMILLAIPLILGCIGGGEEDIEFAGCIPEGIDGLVINSFTPDLAEIFSDEEVTLTLELQNLGGSEATGIEADLINNDGLTPISGETIVQRIADMDAPEEGMPDVTELAEWTLEPASASVGTETVNPASSLSFDYRSSGNAMVKFIPKDEWRKMRQDGETVTIAQTCSDGPLAVSVEPLKAPITEDTGEFTTRVVIKNIGGGNVRTGAMDTLGEIKLVLDDSQLEVGSVCDFMEEGTNLVNKEGLDTLNRNGELTLSCKLRLADNIQTIREAEYEVGVEVEYRYIVDTSTTVSVTAETSTLALKLLDPKTASEWKTGKDATFMVKVDPRHNGESICKALNGKVEGFSATIKNDDVAAQKTRDPVTKVECKDQGTPDTEDDVLEITFEKPLDPEDPLLVDWDDLLYYDDPDHKVLSVLTVELEYSNKKSTVLVEDITVTE